jgi:hypothetical protein
MIVPLLLVLLAFAAWSAWSSWRAQISLLARLRSEWGDQRDRPRDRDAIPDFFRSHDATGSSLDDRTWDDLLLERRLTIGSRRHEVGLRLVDFQRLTGF